MNIINDFLYLQLVRLILIVRHVPVQEVIGVNEHKHRVLQHVEEAYTRRKRVLLDQSFVKVVQPVIIVYLEQLHQHSVLRVCLLDMHLTQYGM